MKKLIILFPILLSGCALFSKPIPVKLPFPDAPTELKTSCPNLKSVEENETHLSNIIGTVVDNYAQYEQCRNKVDAWIEWHKLQKEIADKVK